MIMSDFRTVRNSNHTRVSINQSINQSVYWRKVSIVIQLITTHAGADQCAFLSMFLLFEFFFQRTVVLLYHNPCRLIEQVTVTKLLGIYISATFSTVTHVEHILNVANQRMYLVTQLKNQGLSHAALDIYSQLLRMLFYHLRDSYQKQTKVALIICSAKLTGEGFVANHLPLKLTSYPPETKNYFTK